MDESFYLKPCDCEYSDPVIVRNGEAKQITRQDGTEEAVYFTDFDGYRAECLNCGRETKHFRLKKQAVNAWNNNESKVY
ncbi:MAG: hypothetical protein PHR82_08665 [Endomicrobiaceae bacterium]|nr:hypothetical protein [Endomicrobiaceae bacterium]